MTDNESAAKHETTVLLDEAKDQVRKVCTRLALLHYAFTETLVGELGNEKGKQTAMNAMNTVSLYLRAYPTKCSIIANRLQESPRSRDD